MTRSPDRTHTKPLTRSPAHAACRHVRLWEYRHTTVRAGDLPSIAKAFGITEPEVIETATRIRKVKNDA